MDYSTSYSYSTSSSNISGGTLFAILAISTILAIVMIVAMWKVFQKAGKPGWAAIIPIYNMWVLFEVAGKPGWYALLGLLGVIPVIGFIGSIAYIVLYIIAALEIARRFGKSGVFAVFGLILFPFVGYTMLGFGKDAYKGKAAATPVAPPAQPAT